MHKDDKMFEFIFNSVPSFVAYIDKDQKYRLVNQKYVDWFGLSADEIVGREMKSLWGKEVYEVTSRNFSKALNGSKVSFEITIVNNNGKRTYIDVTYIPDKTKEGDVNGVVVIGHDITKEKKIQKDLKNRIRQEEVVTNLGLEALSGIEIEKLINNAIQTLKTSIDIDFIKVLKLMPDKKRMLLIAGIGWDPDVRTGQTVVDTGKSSQAGYTLLSKKPVVVRDLATDKRFNGPKLLSRHNIKSGMSCIIWGINSPWGVLGVHSKYSRNFTKVDVTILQSVANILALAIQRKDIEQQKDDMISIASHELKTPLTSLKAFAQILARREDWIANDKERRMITKLNQQAEKLTVLIDDILNLSRIKTGKLKFREEEIDMTGLTKQVVRYFQDTQDTHKVIVKSNGVMKVNADPDRIEQVLMNLLTNAVKYSPNSDKVEVKLKEVGDDAVVSVKDYGIGIGSDDLKHIFEPFFRTDHKKERSIPGFGLGLYIASEIVKRHGGKIWVDSKPGYGAEFSFSIPTDNHLNKIVALDKAHIS